MTASLARRQIRLSALAAIVGANIQNVGAPVTIESPGDWTTPPEVLPAILLRAPGDRKESKHRGQPQFDTTVTIEIEARVQALTAMDAQDAIEDLCLSIEQALLTNYDLISITQQVAAVETKTEITSEGREHFGGAMMHFVFECFESFDPFEAIEPPALNNMKLHIDLVGTFDPTGTYPDPPFPDSVTPAPRTSGPDGRDEGALDINLPQ
jgi:hypothetical protein